MKWTEYPYDEEDLGALVESFAIGESDPHTRITHALKRPDDGGPPSAYGAVAYLALVHRDDFWDGRIGDQA